MKGNKTIISKLNQLLTQELTAMDIYFLHSRIYQDYGLTKLFERINHEMTDETGHASLLMERILFLEGMPELGTRAPYTLTTDVKEMIQVELNYEYENSKLLKEVIATCEAEKDFGTREIIMTLLKDTEEDHINWLETQLGLIDKIGIERYLQSASQP
ncbi:bacterioferritin [Bacteriovorax sp. Seq25_V]|uniref:bacterioferritin n=1 Tax=Bacteriovorax sp. Seq25_V TaxID=1201288 RepID=UPI00038A31CA|nr:bacterioferritin [Bacteriovorax sp. Seq25_V]EQC44033.1 bacterioferritin [Bacteriovorax sp. Seq25_V]